MALDTFEVLWKAVQLRCPMAGPFLAQQWVTHTFREIVEKRRWSWLCKRAQFLVFNVVNAGTVTVTFQQNTVQGAGATAWTAALVGRQFRIGLLFPIYTITAVDVTNQILTLDDIWGGTTASAQNYQIYQAYVTVPSDFHSFVSVYDPAFAWQLWWQVKQEELNAWDAQRASSGTAYALAQFTYDTSVTPPLPRYEIWPHQLAQKPFPYVYETRPPDLNDAGASLPRYITGNILIEGALAKAAMWPGPDRQNVNPYFNLGLAQMHRRTYDALVAEAERQDDEVYEIDVSYGQLSRMPWAPFPLGDASYLQSHSF